MNTPKLLKIADVARQLGISRDSIRRAITKGQIPAIVISETPYVTEGALHDFIASVSITVPTTSTPLKPRVLAGPTDEMIRQMVAELNAMGLHEFNTWEAGFIAQNIDEVSFSGRQRRKATEMWEHKTGRSWRALLA